MIIFDAVTSISGPKRTMNFEGRARRTQRFDRW